MKIFYVVSQFLLLASCAVSQIAWERLDAATSDDLHDIFFLNDSIGWTYSYGTGLLLQTTDYGANWNVLCQLDSLYFEQIQFIDSKIGFICGGNNQVLKSTDGGVSWRPVSMPESPNHFELYLTYAMHFRDHQIGLVAQGCFNYTQRNGRKYVDWQTGEYRLLKTTNGGATWAKLSPSPPDFLLTFTFLDDSTLYSGGMSDAIYRSVDGGLSWSTVFRDTSVGQIRSICFPDPQVGLASTWNGFVLKSIDQGRNWSKSKISDGPLRSISFIDQFHGVLVGSSRQHSLYSTKNSGSSWQNSNDRYPDLHRVCRSPSYLWVCGKNGTILRGSKK